MIQALAIACGSGGDDLALGLIDARSDASSPEASSSGSSGRPSTNTGDGSDPCAVLANGTALNGCVPMYCECVDGTRTTVGGGCSSSGGSANCTLGCARNGGSGVGKPVENIYASAECRAYCNMLFGLGCGEGSRTSIELSVQRECSFVRTIRDGGVDANAFDAATTCADTAKQNLTCLVENAKYACHDTGFGGPSSCRFPGDAVRNGCQR